MIGCESDCQLDRRTRAEAVVATASPVAITAQVCFEARLRIPQLMMIPLMVAPITEDTGLLVMFGLATNSANVVVTTNLSSLIGIIGHRGAGWLNRWYI